MDWLGHVMIEADCSGEQRIGPFDIRPANRDQKRPIHHELAANFLRYVVTAHFRHGDVENYGIRLEAAHGCEDFRPLIDSPHLMAFILEDRHERVYRVLVIVGDNDAERTPVAFSCVFPIRSWRSVAISWITAANNP